MKPDFKKRSLLQSFRDAFQGLWFCIQNERNMRIHTVMALYVTVFSPFLGISRVEYALLLLTISLTISAEIINTSVEEICDFICVRYSKKIGIIKNICAGAVFISAFFAIIIGLVILLRPTEILALLTLIFTRPLYITLLISSLVISIIYITIGPKGIKKLIYKKKE